jgi:hypothetical protein
LITLTEENGYQNRERIEIMSRLSSIVFTLFISLGIGGHCLAQQSSPISAEELNQLIQRIESLEQTVQELQTQLQSQGSSEEGSSEAPIPQAAQAAVPSPAQDTPKSDPGIRISGLAFGDFFWTAANHNESLKDNNGFWFRRIYLTFDKAMTEQLDMRVRFEMNSAGNFTSNQKLEPFAKDAWVRWKFTDQHQAYLGLSPTPTMNVVDSIWGYRFLEKSLLDLQRIGATRDLGVAFRGSLGSERKVRYHFMVGNGSSTRGEVDRGKGTLASLGFYPSDSLVLEFYGDYNQLPEQADRNTYYAFLAYKKDWGRLAIQYAHQERKGVSKVNLDLMSFFGIVNLSPKLALVGRYDRMFDPNPEGSRIAYIPFDPTAKFHFFLTGIDWKVTEEFSLIPNVEVVRYDKREDGTRPATDVIPRVTFYYNF